MKKSAQTSSQRRKISSNLATITIKLDRTGELRLDLDYIKPTNLINTLQEHFPEYANTPVLCSIIYDAIGVYEDLHSRVSKSIQNA